MAPASYALAMAAASQTPLLSRMTGICRVREFSRIHWVNA